MATIRAEPLSAESFAGFGEVIEARPGASRSINAGFADKYPDLARIDVAAQHGRPALHLYRARARPLPLQARTMERHLLGSQAFVPLADRPFLVVVSPAGDVPQPGRMRAFLAEGSQGCNIARGVWHHPLIALHDDSLFVVVDRAGAGEDCEVFELAEAVVVLR